MDRSPFRRRAAAAAASFAALLLLGPTAGIARAEHVGPSDAQRAAIAALVKADGAAKAAFEPIRRAADEALTAAPNPIEKITSEGRLQSDPLKKKTWASLADMGKLNALAWSYVATGRAEYADAVRRFLLAWAKTNRATGDPIDETNLQPAIFAYDVVKPTFADAADRQAVETWLRSVAATEQSTFRASRRSAYNNWHSHRLKVVGLIAYALDDKDLIRWTLDAYRTQIEKNLEPDGSSWDFHERDALHYHTYDLEPLLALAAAAQRSGEDLYHYAAPNGASLAKSVAWLVPYAKGAQTHAEFVNSKVAFDRKRAAAGEAGYKSGRLWSPGEGTQTFTLAACFEPALYEPIARQLIDSRPQAAGNDGYRWLLTVDKAMGSSGGGGDAKAK